MKRMYVFKKVLTIALITSMTATVLMGCGRQKADDNEQSVVNSEEPQAPVSTDEKADKVEENSDKTEEAATEASVFPITIVYHYISCKDGDKELATGKYPEFTFTDEFSKKYPNLRSTLETFNENWKTTAVNTTAEYGYYKQENDYGVDGPFAYEYTVEIVRADEKLFTFSEYFYEFAGGAHPNHGAGYYNFDPETGNQVPLKDVITIAPGAEQSQMFWQRLYDTYPDNEEEFKDYDYGYDYETGEEVDTFAKKLEDDNFSWAQLPDGLHIYFSPYEVLYYAAGYLEMTFSETDYPDLVKAEYKTTETFDAEKNVLYVDGETTDMIPREPVFEGTETISNPTWKSFCTDSYKNADAKYVTLEKTKEEKSDWLDTNVWCQTYNFDPKEFPYTIDEYSYAVASPVEYDYMYTELIINEYPSGDQLYDFDLYNLGNGPDAEKDKYSAATQYIRWAQIKDGILYVELSMNGYASEEPDSSYIVAIDLDTKDVIFRTEPQTANAENFVIEDDAIICGYGFTSEPDFIYILDRFTGEKIEKIKVNSAPDLFKVRDDTLYVATYNTAYEFKIKEK